MSYAWQINHDRMFFFKFQLSWKRSPRTFRTFLNIQRSVWRKICSRIFNFLLLQVMSLFYYTESHSQLLFTNISHFTHYILLVSYLEIGEGESGRCSSCYCCDVCARKCGCEGDMTSSLGLFQILDQEIPQNFSKVSDYIRKKIKEEAEEEETDETSEDYNSSSSSDLELCTLTLE